MTAKKRKTNAGDAVKAIVEDIQNRLGLCTEWNQIPLDIRQEIAAKWTEIIDSSSLKEINEQQMVLPLCPLYAQDPADCTKSNFMPVEQVVVKGVSGSFLGLITNIRGRSSGAHAEGHEVGNELHKWGSPFEHLEKISS